jgi:hypothetical protein
MSWPQVQEMNWKKNIYECTFSHACLYVLSQKANDWSNNLCFEQINERTAH